MKASQRTAALGLALAAALVSLLIWLLMERTNGGPTDSATPEQPVASPAPDRTRALTVEVYSHGHPVGDAGVLVQHTELADVFSTQRTDQKGKVAFPSLPPGSYRVTAMQFGYEQRSKTIELSNPRHVLRLTLTRAETTAEPSASAAPPDASSLAISGRVVDERGAPVPRAQVGASSSAAPVFVEADDEGRFEFTNLGATRLNLFATAPGRASAQMPGVSAGSNDVVIVMSDPASVRGTLTFDVTPEKLFVRLCRHDPAHDKEVCIKSKYSSPPDKNYELDRLPPGEFDLVFSDGSVELGRVGIRIASGEQLEMPLQRL